MYSYMTWFFFPIKSTDTNWALFTDNAQFHIQPVVTGFFSEKRHSENHFCCLFSGSLGWSWVIIRIEIKSKSCVSLSSNLPRVIAASGLGDKFDRSMTLGKFVDNNAELFIFIS